MSTQLIIVEGLPGSGKSTISQLVSEILAERGVEIRLFQEGNLDHPADYEGVSFYTEHEFHQLILDHVDYKGLLENSAIREGDYYYIPYLKMINEFGAVVPEQLLQELYSKDIYELPFEKNVKLITEKWKRFTENTHSNSVTIFECCFIQNPLTIGIVKNNVQKQKVMNYVLQLENIIKPLQPLLIYIDQHDVKATFEKALNERPKEWSEGFVNYYTTQGLGKARGYSGIEGTLQVLQERKRIELEIYDLLDISKDKIDNSQFNLEASKRTISNILDLHTKF